MLYLSFWVLLAGRSENPLEGFRVCLKNHSSNLHASIYGIFCLHSVDVARYAALIQAKSPANCDAHLAESLFQTHSKHSILPRKTGTWEKRVPSSYD